jgi:hypothetical protein
MSKGSKRLRFIPHKRGKIEIDIELAIPGYEKKHHNNLRGKIPHAYCIEDRSSIGYGLVIRRKSPKVYNEINAGLQIFLKPLFKMAKSITVHNCILRVALFNPIFTSTIRLSPRSLHALGEINAQLEISIYPTDVLPV